jgi:hypothetical protein
MSNTKYLCELLETVDVLNPERACERIGEALQELRQVEADRAKDAELIQQLVDAVDVLDAYTSSLDKIKEKAMEAAKDAGFKPSDR